MSYSTEKSYVLWIRRFILFHRKRHPRDLGEEEVNAFLTYLAQERQVARSTQTQALCAVLFLYKHVLERELGEMKGLIRVRRKKRLPVVLTQEEVKRLLDCTTGVPKLVLTLLYGSGMRLAEGLRLRVKDLDFDRLELTVREGKGGKDRRTMLPESLAEPLQDHLLEVQALHREDVAAGYGRVDLPYALAAKYPNAGTEWHWQYVFPSQRLSRNPRTGETVRHHLYPQTVRRAMKRALRKAKIAKHANVHTMRHSFATALLLAGYDIRTVQELLGHRETATEHPCFRFHQSLLPVSSTLQEDRTNLETSVRQGAGLLSCRAS